MSLENHRGMSMKIRLALSLVLGIMITIAFSAASEIPSDGPSLLVTANLPAVAAGFIVSGNVHQPSTVAVLVTMVIQWTLVSLLVLWAWSHIRKVARKGTSQ
jgi:hypothetical protein